MKSGRTIRGLPPKSRRRAGFSIIELLAVIFVIAMILSLMLPALLSGREAARRVSCVNNLRQISLALQNYIEEMGVLPPGVVNTAGPVPNRPEDYQIGWLVQILPMMEQQYMYSAFDSSLSVFAPENTTVSRVRISTYLCPNEFPSAPLSTAPLPAVKGLGQTSYAGCHHDVEAPIDARNHGVFYLNSSTRRSDLLDGSSLTIFVGEKRISSTDLGWVSGSRSTLRNTGSPIKAGRTYSLIPGALDEGPTEPLFVGGFGSNHKGGANFAFGDGSVRFVRTEIAPAVYRLLGNRDDGEMLDSSQF